MKLKTTHIAALAALSLIGSATATTIYSDSLLGSGTALNGTAADTSVTFAGGTAGATWTAGTVNETATGAFYTTPDEAGAQSGFLPVTVAAGYVYTLQATLTSSGGGGGWTALGFADSSGNGQFNSAGGVKSAWVLVQEASVGAGPQFFGGPGTANGFSNAGGNWLTTATGTQTVTITLDTTAAAWTTFATIGGVNSNTFTYGTNPTITHAGFGQAFTDSTISNFSLSAVAPVPEPSAAILGAVGVLAFFRRRRA